MLMVRLIPGKKERLTNVTFFLSSIRAYRSRRNPLGKDLEKGGGLEI